LRPSITLKTGLLVAGLLGMFTLAQAQMGGGSMTPNPSAAGKEKEKAADPNDACGPRKMTKKVDKPLLDAQKARGEKNWDEVIAKVNEAEAVPVEKSPFDMFWIREFRGIANVNLKKYPEALNDLGQGFESPCMDPGDKPARSKLLMQIAFQTKDYPKAIQFGKKAQELNPSDPEVGVYLANAYYIANDFENARTVSAATVKQIEDSGRVPEETLYRILQSACLNLKDNDCVVAQIEKLVIHYPKPSYWTDLINSLLRVSSNDKELLNVLRLADGVDVMKEGSQYTEMAQLALAQGLPGEAQAILEKGQQKGAFAAQREKDLATRILADAKQAVTLDKSTLAKQDASARAKPTGEADVKLGAAYLSYGENDKAIEALQRGIGKGGVKNPDEAGLLLGIAYMRSNNKPEAIKAFHTVTQNPGMARVAKMWLINAGENVAAG
jgi:tetratricopeptide (TPR) repeat protein